MLQALPLVAEVISPPTPTVIPINEPDYRIACMHADLMPDGGDSVRPTSDFSSGARVEAERPNADPVALMNGKQLVGLLVEHGIGVQRTAHDLLELGSLTVEEE